MNEFEVGVANQHIAICSSAPSTDVFGSFPTVILSTVYDPFWLPELEIDHLIWTIRNQTRVDSKLGNLILAVLQLTFASLTEMHPPKIVCILLTSSLHKLTGVLQLA